MVAILMLGLLLSVPAFAQQSIKIGFVDLQKAISLSKAGKAAKTKFQSRFKGVEGKLRKERKELERLKADLEKKSLLLNNPQKKELERELQRKVRDYQRVMADSRDELRQREREAMDGVIKGIEKATAEVGKRGKFTLVVSRNQLLYVDGGIDITKKVVDLYDRSIVGVAAKTK